MDVRRVTAGAGVVAAFLVTILSPSPPVAVGAGVAGAVAALTVDRDAPGLVAASLAVAAAASLTASAMAGADSSGRAVVSLFVAAGLAGCLAAALEASTANAASGRRRPSTVGVLGGRVAGLLGAWTAIVLAGTATLALLTASAQPFGSLLGARLATLELAPLLLAVPVAIAAGAGWVALGAWRQAGLPPWPFVAGPAALLAGWAVVFLPAASAFDSLLAGRISDAAVAYVLLWSTATVLVASALAGAVAADDPRFRRGPAWTAVAAGPLALGVFVATRGGGSFVAAALTTVPSSAGAFGAVVETAAPSTAAAFLAALTVSGLALAATIPARTPLCRELTAGRPAGVGAGCLLVTVALAGMGPRATALAGGLAVLSWVLLTDEPSVAPPPRTALSRAGVAALAVGAGSLLAVSLVGLPPRTDPGVGGALLLVGVALLGLAIR